jgi:hypothetical protein
LCGNDHPINTIQYTAPETFETKPKKQGGENFYDFVFYLCWSVEQSELVTDLSGEYVCDLIFMAREGIYSVYIRILPMPGYI